MCPHQYFPLAFETLHFQTLLYCIFKNVLTLYKNTLKNKDILQQSNQCERINSFSLVTLGNTFLFFFLHTSSFNHELKLDFITLRPNSGEKVLFVFMYVSISNSLYKLSRCALYFIHETQRFFTDLRDIKLELLF